MIDYILQLNAFNRLLGGKLAPASRALYYILLDVNNTLRWTREFSVSNEYLQLQLRIANKKTFDNARNELIQCGLIEYRRGKKGSPSTYSIKQLHEDRPLKKGKKGTDSVTDCDQKRTKNVPYPYQICNPYINYKQETENVEQEREGAREAPAPPHPLSPAEEEPKGKRKPKRHLYGSFKNVPFSDDELAKAKAEFPDDWEQRIEKISEYCASHGTNYKNGLATIRNWARRDAERRTQNASVGRKPAETDGGWGEFDNTYTQEQLEGGSDEAWAKYKSEHPPL